jgi:dihydropyrimidine dehydrogenase (NAD+) subunit PreT
MSLGIDITLDELREEFDAVFLGFGLGGVNKLGIANEDVEGVLNAVNYIAELRQAEDKSILPVGRRVVVIGGGMTAIDVAVQSKQLGSEYVDIVYRRGPEQMGASHHEQELAQTSGVTIRHWAAPKKLLVSDRVSGIEFEKTNLGPDGELQMTGETWSLDADIIFKAVGQSIASDTLGDVANTIGQERGKLQVNEERKTSLDDVWAGGDCIAGHDDLTVSAVQDGKMAAISIDQYLRG